MDLINKHIRSNLEHFLKSENSHFDSVFDSLNSSIKDSFKPLLFYIYRLLSNNLNAKNANILHLHFESDIDEDAKIMIAEFLWRYFLNQQLESNIGKEQNAILSNKISFLEGKTNTDIILEGTNNPYLTASEKRKIKRRDKEKFIQRVVDKRHLGFYKNINPFASLIPTTVLNFKINQEKSLSELFIHNPTYVNVSNLKDKELKNLQDNLTYNLINTEYTINRLDEINSFILDNLKTILFFDFKNKNFMNSFSLEKIKEFEILLENFIVLTFGSQKGKNISTETLKAKINSIQKVFEIPEKATYVVFDVESTSDGNLNEDLPIFFAGEEISIFWDAFVQTSSIYNLYELRSIKMMNLYSLCINESIKDYILENIFSNTESSNIISDETKQSLTEISEEVLFKLREKLELVLNSIIDSDYYDKVLSAIEDLNPTLLLDDFIVRNKDFIKLLLPALSLDEKAKLTTWSKSDGYVHKNLLILTYRDPGVYPFRFYPNILENNFSTTGGVKALFHNFFFSHKYKWAKFNLLNDIYQLANHPIRIKHFQWQELGSSIKDLRPTSPISLINWDLEDEYTASDDRQTVRLMFADKRERIFNASDLFIHSEDKVTFRVDRLIDMIEIIDTDDQIQHFVFSLDEVQEKINLYEQIKDTRKQEDELKILRKQFNLDDDDDGGRLWKVLLIQKAANTSEEVLYEELEAYMLEKGVNMVKFHHFKNDWLNTETDSLAPREKKMFIELCNFLKIPDTYYYLIQHLRNTSRREANRQTRRMNNLLKTLVNDRAFDENINLQKIVSSNIEKYKRELPLDELGIDEVYLEDSLVTLMELIKEEICLQEINQIKFDR